MSDVVKTGVLGLNDVYGDRKPVEYITFNQKKGALVYADKNSKTAYVAVDAEIERVMGAKMTTLTWSKDLNAAFRKALETVAGAPAYIAGVRGAYKGIEHVVRNVVGKDGVEVTLDQVVVYLEGEEKDIALQFPSDSDVGISMTAAAINCMKVGEVYTIRAENRESKGKDGRDYVNVNLYVNDLKGGWVNQYDNIKDFTAAVRASSKAAYDVAYNSPAKMAEDKKKAMASASARGAKAYYIGEAIAEHNKHKEEAGHVNDDHPANQPTVDASEHDDIPF